MPPPLSRGHRHRFLVTHQHLGGGQFAVQHIGLDQFLVRPRAAYPAVFEHHDLIRARHRGEPVRDQQHGAAPRRLLDRLAQRSLVVRVELRRRLVEQQHLGTAQQGPRDGEPLPLTARQRDAPAADLRPQPVRKPLDQRVEPGQPQHLRDLLVRHA